MGYNMNTVKINKSLIGQFLGILHEAQVKHNNFKEDACSANLNAKKTYDNKIKEYKEYMELESFADFLDTVNNRLPKEIMPPITSFYGLLSKIGRKITRGDRPNSIELLKSIKQKISDNIDGDLHLNFIMLDEKTDILAFAEHELSYNFSKSGNHALFIVIKTVDNKIIIKLTTKSFKVSVPKSPYDINKIKQYIAELNVMLDVGEATVSSNWLAYINSLK
jgi:hypothetical protein